MWVQGSRGIAQYGATCECTLALWALCRHHYIPEQGNHTVSHIIWSYFMRHLQSTYVVLNCIFFRLGHWFSYSVAGKAWRVKPHMKVWSFNQSTLLLTTEVLTYQLLHLLELFLHFFFFCNKTISKNTFEKKPYMINNQSSQLYWTLTFIFQHWHNIETNQTTCFK